MVQVVATLGVALVLAVLFFIGRAFGKARMLILAGWLAFTAMVAASGVLSDFEARPPRMMLLIGASLVVFTLVTRGDAFRKMLLSTPSHGIVAVMGMRLPIELGLWALHHEGRVPLHFTFEGRNFDVLVGLSAPIVAYAMARGWLTRRGVIVWNVLSLGLLANIVGMALTTFPGPLHLRWPGPVPTIMTTWPFVWLPSFLVPVALFGHILSLRRIFGGAYDDRREGNAGPRVMDRPADARSREGARILQSALRLDVHGR